MSPFGWPLCVICVGHLCCCRCCCCWCSSNTVFCRWWCIGSAAWLKPPWGSRRGSCSSLAIEGDRKCSSDTAKGKEGNRHNTNTKTSTWLYNWGWGFSRSQWERPHGYCNRESKSWSGCCTCGKNEKKVEVVVVVLLLYLFKLQHISLLPLWLIKKWLKYKWHGLFREKRHIRKTPPEIG